MEPNATISVDHANVRLAGWAPIAMYHAPMARTDQIVAKIASARTKRGVARTTAIVSAILAGWAHCAMKFAQKAFSGNTAWTRVHVHQRNSCAMLHLDASAGKAIQALTA